MIKGRYEITKKLAEGAFGQTFLAKDTQRPGEPTCVVKQLKPAAVTVARRLFNTEAEMLENLGKHDQIPQLLAYVEENGEFYLVQEYIAGHPLTDELKPGEPLEEAQVMSILLELLSVLEFVHAQNVIHRDIKPDNIIRRDADGKLVLIDFGAVKKIVSQSNTQRTPHRTILIGTPGYMPNEQIDGQPKLSSDVYAVGMVAIQAITGIYPTQLPKDSQTKEVIWPNQAQVSPELAAVLEKMVYYDYRQRYSSAKEALAAVQALQTPPVNPTIVSPPRGSKLPIGAISGVAAVALLVPIVIYLLPKDEAIFPDTTLKLNGEAIAGVLDENDIKKPLNNSYMDVYMFAGSSGDKVTIEVKSNDFDSKLEVLDSNNNSLGTNDDREHQDYNSRVVVELPATGQYTVVVTSADKGEVGNYYLVGKVVNK